MMAGREVAEVIKLRSPEDYTKDVEETMRMMESDDPVDGLEAQSMLDGSRCIARGWEFYWPPKVFLVRVFDDPMAAERVAKSFRDLGIEAKRVLKRLDDKVLPAVKIDWEAHYLLGELFNEAFGMRWSNMDEEMNEIVRKYLAEKSEKKALKILAREAGKMAAGLMKRWESDGR